jgi:hypothetical protein
VLADNVWYGLNALPPITSAISIDGAIFNPGTLNLKAVTLTSISAIEGGGGGGRVGGGMADMFTGAGGGMGGGPPAGPVLSRHLSPWVGLTADAVAWVATVVAAAATPAAEMLARETSPPGRRAPAWAARSSIIAVI